MKSAPYDPVDAPSPDKPAPTRFIRKKLKTSRVRHLSSTQIIIVGFFLIILFGTLLLMLPIASAENDFTSLDTAFFTSVSAACVTGLTVVPTGEYWSIFGQLVILLLIQIGGLGFMTLAVMLSIFVKRQITPRERVVVAQSLGISGVGGMVRLVKRILTGTLVIESAGAVLLATQFVPRYGIVRGIYYGFFHAVSAFCNAGFDLLNGLQTYQTNYVFGITLMVLIILGGIGFVVWDDLLNILYRRGRFSFYSKFVLILTFGLILTGAFLVGFFEWNNPETLGGLDDADKIYQSFFQSVSLRTAGFELTDNAVMTESTQLVNMFYMLIGGASGSTAGGIKVVTLGVLLVAVFGYATGKSEIVIWNRRIPDETIIRALSITVIDLAACIGGALVISAAENTDLITAMYETVAAMSTTGITLELTPALSLVSQIIIMLLMFFGRVGILTITYSIMLNQARRNSCIHYPEVTLMIG